MKRFRQFYMDNGEKLFGYLLRKSGHAHFAADLVQETFIRYFERYPDQKESTPLLFTIGRNLFYDHIRRQPIFVEHRLEDVAQKGGNQEEKYIAREETERILAAMQKLNEEEQDILALIVSSSMTYHEIAEIRGCSVANIKVKVHRARKKLKLILKGTDHE